jgi:hypothetical protein
LSENIILELYDTPQASSLEEIQLFFRQFSTKNILLLFIGEASNISLDGELLNKLPSHT